MVPGRRSARAHPQKPGAAARSSRAEIELSEAGERLMSMRLFVGIALAPDVTGELTRLTARLRRNDDGLRWSAAESWHVTLEFLGAAEREQYECVCARLREIHRPPVPIRL